MNDDQKEAMKVLITIIRKCVKKKSMADITDCQRPTVTKEDLWMACITIDMGKKYGFINTKK